MGFCMFFTVLLHNSNCCWFGYNPNSNLLPWMRLKCLEFMRKANLREGERISIEGRSDEKDSNEKVSIKVDGGRVSR